MQRDLETGRAVDKFRGWVVRSAGFRLPPTWGGCRWLRGWFSPGLASERPGRSLPKAPLYCQRTLAWGSAGSLEGHLVRVLVVLEHVCRSRG